MKKLVLVAGAVALAIWSLLAWAGHGLLIAVGGLGANNADLLPVPPEWVVFVSETLQLATGLSGVIVVTIWLIGALLIGGATLVGAFVAGRIARRDRAYGGRAFPAHGPVIDLDDRGRPYDRDGEYRRGLGIGQAIGRALRDRRYGS
jgi:hypothetical protein